MPRAHDELLLSGEGGDHELLLVHPHAVDNEQRPDAALRAVFSRRMTFSIGALAAVNVAPELVGPVFSTHAKSCRIERWSKDVV